MNKKPEPIEKSEADEILKAIALSAAVIFKEEARLVDMSGEYAGYLTVGKKLVEPAEKFLKASKYPFKTYLLPQGAARIYVYKREILSSDSSDS